MARIGFHPPVLPLRTLSPDNETVQAGRYKATTLSAVDAELATGNIRDGITIFGFAGTLVEGTDISDADAAVGDVKDGLLFYSVAEPRKEGTMPTVALSAANSNYPAGYHAGEVGGLVDVDEHLVTGNIKSGITIFGVAGKAEVVDTSSGDAVAGDIRTGKKAWVDGAEVTGDIAEVAIAAGSEAVPAGIHTATNLSTIDGDLAVANIKKDVNIFGKVGTFESTITHDTQLSDIDAQDQDESERIYHEWQTVPGSDDKVMLTLTLTCLQATVIEAAYFVVVEEGNFPMKIQMFIDGTAQGEVDVQHTADNYLTYSDIGNKAVSSGDRVVYLNAHNYDASAHTIRYAGGIFGGCCKL